SGEANQKWKRPANRRGAFAGFVDVTGNLAQGTKDNEALRVFAAARYDDVTLRTALHARAQRHRHEADDDQDLRRRAHDVSVPAVAGDAVERHRVVHRREVARRRSARTAASQTPPART